MTALETLGYRRFAPPAQLTFGDWSRREARHYFEWFVTQIPDRLTELGRIVTAIDLGCHLSLAPDSLKCLGQVFVGLLSTRMRSSEELSERRDELPNHLRDVVQPEGWELTEETLSLCVDVGVYFAEVIRSTKPTLNWALWTRRTVDYHRPVLVGFRGAVPLDPIRVVINTALAEVAGDRRPDCLHELYDVWSAKVAEA